MGAKTGIGLAGGTDLTEKQLIFCQLYAMSEMRGNGVMCYARAYGIDLSEKGGYNTAKVGASQALTKHNILDYIRSLYEENDLNDTVVDNELAFVIKQNADFGSKVAAIKEYNQLKQRIIKKLELSTGGADELVIKSKTKPVDDK